MDFEKTMKEIEDIIQKLESGELNLEESIALYTKSMESCNECSKYLTDIKGKIEILNEQEKNTDNK